MPLDTAMCCSGLMDHSNIKAQPYLLMCSCRVQLGGRLYGGMVHGTIGDIDAGLSKKLISGIHVYIYMLSQHPAINRVFTGCWNTTGFINARPG